MVGEPRALVQYRVQTASRRMSNCPKFRNRRDAHELGDASTLMSSSGSGVRRARITVIATPTVKHTAIASPRLFNWLTSGGDSRRFVSGSLLGNVPSLEQSFPPTAKPVAQIAWGAPLGRHRVGPVNRRRGVGRRDLHAEVLAPAVSRERVRRYGRPRVRLTHHLVEPEHRGAGQLILGVVRPRRAPQVQPVLVPARVAGRRPRSCPWRDLVVQPSVTVRLGTHGEHNQVPPIPLGCQAAPYRRAGSRIPAPSHLRPSADALRHFSLHPIHRVHGRYDPPRHPVYGAPVNALHRDSE